jgi:hypothetical protein
LATEAAEAARTLWASCKDQQVVVWLDNWYRKRFSTDPRNNDMSLNVSVTAVLHISEIPMFQGYKSLRDLVTGIPVLVQQLMKVAARVIGGVQLVVEEDLHPECIRVPLDVHRTGMRSLQWSPYFLTEQSVSSQTDLLNIILELEGLQRQTRRALPLLVDMDIHYRLMKLIYGSSTAAFDMGMKMSQIPVLYGVCS